MAGRRGIRTPDTFAVYLISSRRLRPLGHLSAAADYSVRRARRACTGWRVALLRRLGGRRRQRSWGPWCSPVARRPRRAPTIRARRPGRWKRRRRRSSASSRPSGRGSMAGLSGFRLLPAGIDSFTPAGQHGRHRRAHGSMRSTSSCTAGRHRAPLHQPPARRGRPRRARAPAARRRRTRRGPRSVAAALDAHPQHRGAPVQSVPIRAAGGRCARRARLRRLKRLSYRMHNKLMAIDNSIAIAGGRNIGDEYFAANRSSSSATSTCSPRVPRA